MTFDKKAYMKEYSQRLKVKVRRKKYIKAYRNKPENKVREKEHNQRPEVKARKKVYLKRWRQSNKEKILNQRKEFYLENREMILKKSKEYNQRPEVKARRRIYNKKHNQKLEVKDKRNVNNRNRIKIDKNYAVKESVRKAFLQSMKIYSTTGKIMSTSKYLDMKAIIKKLTPFPKDRENYHIDHIIPLVKFNHDDPEQIKKAWYHSNLQWLTKEENLKKGSKIL